MTAFKKLESWHVVRDGRRYQYIRAALVGLGAGLVALLFQHALHFAEDTRADLLKHLQDSASAWGWAVLPVICAGIGALVGWMTSRFAPEAAGSGIPHVKGVLTHVKTISWSRLLPVKFLGGLLCIGSGFSLGREGPTVQMGAATAKFLSEKLHVPAKAEGRLIACGAGAGLAAAFHAPLAGFIFTVEELQREFSPLTYAMALIAAVVADIVAASVWGSDNVFHLMGYPSAPMQSIPILAVLGVFAGITGAGFNKTLLGLQNYCHDHVTMPTWQRAALVGLLVGLVAWWFPEIVGGGHQISEQILQGDFAGSASIGFILLLFAGKFVLTILSYLSGVPGGIFAPMLFMGGCLGLLLGVATSEITPELVPIPESFAAVGMAAFFTAVVRAPLTGIVLVMEMTGDYQQLLPLILASMIAYIVSEQLKVEPVYDALLAADVKRKQPRVWEDRDPLLFEFVVHEGSQMDGLPIREIPLPERCLFVTVTRHGDDILPTGDTVIHRGDHITAIVTGAEAGEAVNKLLPLSRV